MEPSSCLGHNTTRRTGFLHAEKTGLARRLQSLGRQAPCSLGHWHHPPQAIPRSRWLEMKKTTGQRAKIDENRTCFFMLCFYEYHLQHYDPTTNTLRQAAGWYPTRRPTKHTTSYYRVRYCVLCYAMLCYAMPCHAMPCHAMPCDAMRCDALLCYAMRCDAMLCYECIAKLS